MHEQDILCRQSMQCRLFSFIFPQGKEKKKSYERKNVSERERERERERKKKVNYSTLLMRKNSGYM